MSDANEADSTPDPKEQMRAALAGDQADELRDKIHAENKLKKKEAEKSSEREKAEK